MSQSTNGESLFEAFLKQHDEEAWSEVVAALLPSIHEVDKTATQIWFKFFPLALHDALQWAEDSARLAEELLLGGRYDLKDQIDSSHVFLYGHRYWPEVKRAVEEFAGGSGPPQSLELAAQILDVARGVSRRSQVPEGLLVGITMVAFMTLQQVGAAAFRGAPGKMHIQPKFFKVSPEAVLKARKRDDRQGWLSFLWGEVKQYTITFDESQGDARFKLIASQELATAAASDKRDYHSRDPRCVPAEGPIPVQCRAASCGSCWVGILAGAEKLSSVASFESKRMKEFGYIDSGEARPIIRLACQAKAFGAVSIVIPPWNGVFGRFLQKLKDAKPDRQEATNL